VSPHAATHPEVMPTWKWPRHGSKTEAAGESTSSAAKTSTLFNAMREWRSRNQTHDRRLASKCSYAKPLILELGKEIPDSGSPAGVLQGQEWACCGHGSRVERRRRNQRTHAREAAVTRSGQDGPGPVSGAASASSKSETSLTSPDPREARHDILRTPRFARAFPGVRDEQVAQGLAAVNGTDDPFPGSIRARPGEAPNATIDRLMLTTAHGSLWSASLFSRDGPATT